MGEKNNAKAAKDLVFGVFLVLFGIYIVVASSQMKYLKSFFDGAGFFPMIIGVVLLGLGGVLAFIGVKTGGVPALKSALSGSVIGAFFKSDKFIRVAILLILMVIYMYFLLETIGFLYSTPIYLFCTFMYLRACEKIGPLPGWAVALIISIVTTVIVYYSFKIGLGVILP